MTLPKPVTAAIPDRVRLPSLRPAVALSRRQDVTGPTTEHQGTTILVELWSELEAARAIGVSAQSLSRWRKGSIGPPYLRLGRKVCYRPRDVATWIDSQVQHPIGAFS